MNTDAASVVSRSSRASISRAPTISVNTNKTDTTTTQSATTTTSATTVASKPATVEYVDDEDDVEIIEYVDEPDDEPIVVENKSAQFSSSLGDALSSNSTTSDTALAQMVRAQRAALDAAGNTVAVRSSQTSNTCDTDLRACMTDKCGKNFTKCASDTDTTFGTKLDSCRRNTKCTATEFKAFSAEIKSDRAFAIKLGAFNDIIDCGQNYDACIVNQCGATYSKCLGKSAGDNAISKCNSIAKQCSSMDNGLASRTMSVFATLRQTAEKQISSDEKKLYTMRDQMRSVCSRLGAMLDDRSLDCVYTVNFIAGEDSTLYSSKKAYAGNTFDCTPQWFGIDITTFMENAYRKTRAQTAASSAMLGSGVGMAVGALTSGAIGRAIDTHKAEKALKEAECADDEKWSSIKGKCVHDDTEEKEVEKKAKQDAKAEKKAERQAERDIKNAAKDAEKACKKSGGKWQDEDCDCSGDEYLETQDGVCVVIAEMQYAKNCRDSKGTPSSDGKSCSCPNGPVTTDGTCPTKREVNKAERQAERAEKQAEKDLEQRKNKCLNRGAGGTWFDNTECHCEKPGTQLEDDKCVYKDKESKEAQDKIDNCNETYGDWDYDTNTCTCRNGGTVLSSGKCPSDNAVKRAENRAEKQEEKYIANCTSSNGRMNSTNTECICPGNDVFPDKNGNCPKQKTTSRAEKPTAQRACVDGQLINDECYCNDERTKIADKDGYCKATPTYIANCSKFGGMMNTANTECICPGNDVFPDENGKCPKQKTTSRAEKPTAQRACVDGQLINDECYCNDERTEIAGEDGYCPKAVRTNCTTAELKNLGYEHAVKGTVKQQDKSGNVTKCDITECEYGYELAKFTNKCKESRATKQETKATVKAEKQAEQQKQQELKRQQELCEKDSWGKWSTVPEPICRCGDDRYWTGERCRPNAIQNQRYENCETSNGHVVNKGHTDEYCSCYGSAKPDTNWFCPSTEEIQAKQNANEQELCEQDPDGKWSTVPEPTCRCLGRKQWIDYKCQTPAQTIYDLRVEMYADKSSNEPDNRWFATASRFLFDKYCQSEYENSLLCATQELKCKTFNGTDRSRISQEIKVACFVDYQNRTVTQDGKIIITAKRP